MPRRQRDRSALISGAVSSGLACSRKRLSLECGSSLRRRPARATVLPQGGLKGKAVRTAMSSEAEAVPAIVSGERGATAPGGRCPQGSGHWTARNRGVWEGLVASRRTREPGELPAHGRSRLGPGVWLRHGSPSERRDCGGGRIGSRRARGRRSGEGLTACAEPPASSRRRLGETDTRPPSPALDAQSERPYLRAGDACRRVRSRDPSRGGAAGAGDVAERMQRPAGAGAGEAYQHRVGDVAVAGA